MADHHWVVQRLRHRCKIKSCGCGNYVPDTDEKKPVNRLIGRLCSRGVRQPGHSSARLREHDHRSPQARRNFPALSPERDLMDNSQLKSPVPEPSVKSAAIPTKESRRRSMSKLDWAKGQVVNERRGSDGKVVGTGNY